jgi:hypothetical protein
VVSKMCGMVPNMCSMAPKMCGMVSRMCSMVPKSPDPPIHQSSNPPSCPWQILN